jgi:predicted DCC family thiol-disulfide oxidoreductase YuxK
MRAIYKPDHHSQLKLLLQWVKCDLVWLFKTAPIKIKEEEPHSPITIYYDHACGICRIEMEHYKAKDKKARLKFINVNHSNFDLMSEGLDPQNILDYVHAKDETGKVVYGIEAFVWIWEAFGCQFMPIQVRLPLIKQLACDIYRLFAKFRYKIRRRYLDCSRECDHKMIWT